MHWKDGEILIKIINNKVLLFNNEKLLWAWRWKVVHLFPWPSKWRLRIHFLYLYLLYFGWKSCSSMVRRQEQTYIILFYSYGGKPERYSFRSLWWRTWILWIRRSSYKFLYFSIANWSCRSWHIWSGIDSWGMGISWPDSWGKRSWLILWRYQYSL